MKKQMTQEHRIGKVLSELGEDEIVILKFGGTDHVNGLFEYHVDALSEDNDVDFDQLIGTHMTVVIESPLHGPQYFDGIVTDAGWGDIAENGFLYHFTLRPWTWVMSQRRNNRMFHDMTVVEILEKMFEDWAQMGAPHFAIELTGSYDKLEYTVQYGESDLDFINRMMQLRHLLLLHPFGGQPCDGAHRRCAKPGGRARRVAPVQAL